MDKKQKAALKIAVDCIQKQMKPLSVDANIYLSGIDRGRAFERRAKRYREMAEALKYFEGILSNPAEQLGLFPGGDPE